MELRFKACLNLYNKCSCFYILQDREGGTEVDEPEIDEEEKVCKLFRKSFR